MIWADIFLDNPRQLGVVAAKVPRFIAEQTEYMRVGLRLLGQTDRDGMTFSSRGSNPTTPGTTRPSACIRDGEGSTRQTHAQRPDRGHAGDAPPAAAGLYPEAAAAASRLREALHRALDAQRINPTLASLVELQAEPLYLAGRDAEARQAYERGFHWAQVSGKAFLLADVAGKMALMEVLEGDSAAALRWLAAHDAAIGDVGWGRSMVARTATMARAYLALSGLDYPGFDEAMRALPVKPDNDEFWCVHAHLLALQKINAGIFDAARSLIASLRRERRHAAVAPLAQRLFGDILMWSEILERGCLPAGIGAESGDPLCGTGKAGIRCCSRAPAHRESRRRAGSPPGSPAHRGHAPEGKRTPVSGPRSPESPGSDTGNLAARAAAASGLGGFVRPCDPGHGSRVVPGGQVPGA